MFANEMNRIVGWLIDQLIAVNVELFFNITTTAALKGLLYYSCLDFVLSKQVTSFDQV